MSNPYAQVAMTYLRRPFSSLPGILFVFAFFALALASFIMGCIGDRVKLAIPQLAPFGFLFWLLVFHMKEQFVDSRVHLTPDFRRIHATVAGIAALICAVLLPAAFAWHIGWHSIGFVAITVLLFGTILWMLLFSGWIFFPALIGWPLLLATESGRACLQLLVDGKFLWESVGILAVGVVIVLLGGIRLVQLNEEMPEYQWFKWNFASGKVETIGPKVAQESIYVRWWRRYREERTMANLTRHAKLASVSRWSQVCRWRAGMINGWSIIYAFLPFLLYLFFLTWWMGVGKRSIAFPAMFCSIMPAGAVLILWRGRKSALPRESLMCVDRMAYLKQVGMAVAISQLQAWLGMAAILLCWWQWFSPQIPPVTVAYVLTLSALLQPWCFGVGIWVLRFRSPIQIFLGAMLASQVSAITIFGGEPGPLSSWQPMFLLVAVIVAVLGLVVTWDAYRRWLVTDFD